MPLSFYQPTFNTDLEPNQGNIRQWLDNISARFKPIEQARWNESNIDTLFYAGSQSFVNRYFNFNPTTSFNQYYFNLIQQPVNMMTGYQRQHRKGPNFVPVNNADPRTTDQYTRAVGNTWNQRGLHEQFSKACELSAISGMVLIQPYLDYTQDDMAQGDLSLKVWEYNSFMVDPYFRNPDMSDANIVFCQEFIDKGAAKRRFPHMEKQISTMVGGNQKVGNFYFLPEHQNMSNNNLLVLSYVWYKSTRMRKRMYSRSLNQFFDIQQDDANIEMLVYSIPDMEEVNVEVSTWKVAVVLNDQLCYSGNNPLGFDDCPFVPVFWNYDPHVNYYNYRVRSLVRPMRDPQFLFNYKVITNNDIAAATINAGWKRKSGAVANEDNLKKTQAGHDIIINEGYELTDCEKILPSAIPQSDIELASQMQELIYNTSGINLENWSGQEDKQISSLTAMIKQAANLMVFQKYFDQWDFALKKAFDLTNQIQLNNWNAIKMYLILGEEPTSHYYSKVFAKYQVVVEEGIMTPTQKIYQAKQMMEINEAFGREVLPPSFVIKDMNLQGKAEIMEYLQNQEKNMQQAQSEQQMLEMAFTDAKLKEMYSKSANNIAMAKERYGRFESNIGLLEERISEISKNRALSTKAKMEALEKLVDVIARLGEVETSLKMNEIERVEFNDKITEDQEKKQAHKEALSNEFASKIMNGMMGQGQPKAPQVPTPGM